MKRCSRRISLAAMIVVLAGCASSAPAPQGPVVHPLEQNAINALKRSNFDDADDALSAALIRYQKLDDLAGQWRITRYQANLALAQDNAEGARSLAEALVFLASQLPADTVAYDTALINARVTGDASYFEQALANARDPLERAVSLTYLKRYNEAIELMSPSAIDRPGDRAFVYYSHGVAKANTGSFEQALFYYRAAEDSRGIADTLLRLSVAHENEGDRQTALTYAKRARITLVAAGDNARAEVVARRIERLSGS